MFNDIVIQRLVPGFPSKQSRQLYAVGEIAHTIHADNAGKIVFKICDHLSQNPARKIKKSAAGSPFVRNTV